MRPTEVRPLSAALVVVGVVLLVAAVVLIATGQVGATNYHRVWVPDEQAPAEVRGPVVPFSELSPEGKELFLRTFRDIDRDVETTGPAGRAPDFQYPGDHTTSTYVRYEGTIYRVLTSQNEPFLLPSDSELRAGGLALVGGLALLGGVTRGVREPVGE